MCFTKKNIAQYLLFLSIVCFDLDYMCYVDNELNLWDVCNGKYVII